MKRMQMTKVALSRELQRMMRSLVKERRPQCPVCLQYAPGPDEPRDEWTDPWGHRDCSGSPCPSFQGGLKAYPGQPPLRAVHKPVYEPLVFYKGKRRKPTCQLLLFDVVGGLLKLWNSSSQYRSLVPHASAERDGNSQVRAGTSARARLEKTA